MTRRLYPESKIPMTEAEHARYLAACGEHYEKCRKKGRDQADASRLAATAGERAVQRMRGKALSAEARTLDMFGAR